ncbi:hypothetical protein AMK68_00625 [candidate division KD3-62 bacterium DG_56]|uniref:Uncharacterized protein n=1 Tax=candidate division KD3-62 bacterium DG_56 TaxID=1704032 RepID=A0A0S7XRA3_9BACT|nr:MAG: hypothetical protein AMK68_00625 [candidate division KD3-62 bacterium DG_56]
MRTLVVAVLLAAPFPALAADDGVIWAEYQPECFIVRAPQYEFRFSPDFSFIDYLMAKSGQGDENVFDFYVLPSVRVDDRDYFSVAARRSAEVHPVWIGRYLTQIQIQNVTLASAQGDTWPGLAEMALYCHRDRVYVRVSLLTGNSSIIANDMVVYDAAEGHRECPAQAMDYAGAEFHLPGTSAKIWSGYAIAGEHTFPKEWWHYDTPFSAVSVACEEAALGVVFPERGRPGRLVARRQRGTPPGLKLLAPVTGADMGGVPVTWQPGERHEVFFELIPTTAERLVPDTEAALRNDLQPLTADHFTVTRGEFVGYDPTRGTYRFNAQDAHSPTPVKGYYGGCRFTVSNDDRPRTILIEQFNNWGGLRGAVIRDGEGNPLPIQPQISVNFPERAAEGEHDWGYVIYPLELKPNETRTIWADHLYYGYGVHDQICLFSLENVGDHPLLQTSVAIMESHTVTTGEPELRFNDFRRYKSDYHGYRSVSAVLPSFLRYLDPEGEWHRVTAGPISVQHVGPNLVEYVIRGWTDDSKVELTLHVWQAAHDDMTRVFYRADIVVKEDIEVKQGSHGNLRLLNHHTFNPMYYRKYAFLGADGEVHTGELDLSGTAKEDGTPLPATGTWVAEYYAPNILDYGSMSPEGVFTRMEKDAPGGKWHTCGDIVGNPAFLLRRFDARINGRQIDQPGLYVFAARGGDNPDPGQQYARDLAIVLPELPTRIEAGSTISYEAMSFVYGTLDSGYETAAAEFEQWSAAALQGDFPLRVKAKNGQAEFAVTGGANWMPVMIDGFEKPPVLALRYRRPGSADWQLANLGREGNDWCTLYRDGEGYGALALVPTHQWPGATYRIEMTGTVER